MIVGLGGINTCDMVVDGNGDAVDCSKWGNFFHFACWNPTSPCAADGSVDGEVTSIDNSKSQLGPAIANIIEGSNPGSNLFGVSPTSWILIGAGLVGVILLKDLVR